MRHLICAIAFVLVALYSLLGCSSTEVRLLPDGVDIELVKVCKYDVVVKVYDLPNHPRKAVVTECIVRNPYRDTNK